MDQAVFYLLRKIHHDLFTYEAETGAALTFAQLNEVWVRDNIAQRKDGWVSHDAKEDKLGTRQETWKPASLWIHNICIKVGR